MNIGPVLLVNTIKFVELLDIFSFVLSFRVDGLGSLFAGDVTVGLDRSGAF